MVIYYRALTGSPFSTPLPSCLLTSSQSNSTPTKTLNVSSRNSLPLPSLSLTPLLDITTLTSYFSLLEAGLGLCAACLPVQYGLLHSEKVRSIFRSIYSLATLGSRGSRGSGNSRRSGGARSFRLHDPTANNKNGSQLSEVDVPLPTHAAAAAGHEASQSELEMGNLNAGHAIMVTKSFDASELAMDQPGR